MDWVFSIVMGVVEGLTEFLPVSSTGHLILTSKLFGRADPSFEIAIQLGAITAILVLYWQRLWDALRQMFAADQATRGGIGDVRVDVRVDVPVDVPVDEPEGRVNLLWLILFAALPPAVLALALKDRIEALFAPGTVAVALIAGGVVFLLLEWWRRRRGIVEEDYQPMSAMTIRQALIIGLFQSLALIPGTSRSGATMVGAMLVGFRRTAAAEFSFLVGLPLLYGAGILKMIERNGDDGAAPLGELVIASVAAFLAAILVVKPFVRFLQRHTFAPFAFYRIALGGLVWLMIL